MKDRYERARTGHSTDALEGPDTTPLENQDAELADEQKADIADADRKVERPHVIDPVSGKLVPIPEGGRFYDSGGTLGRRYGGTRGSTKPDDIPSHLWVNMSKSQKKKAIDEANMRAALQEIDDGDGRGSSTDRPAGAASRMNDAWGICGDTLIRYHFKPRHELFSPDLTDCPFDHSRIEFLVHDTPRSFRTVAIASWMMKMIGVMFGGETRNSDSSGLVRLCSRLSLHSIPLLTEMALSRLCLLPRMIIRSTAIN